MDLKRLVIGTIIGAIVLHLLGYLIFDVAAADFYAANQGPATGAWRDFPLQWPLAVANVAYAVLITLALLSGENAPSIGRGFVVGAVIGFLVWVHADFVFYAYTTIRPLPVAIVDPLLEIIHAGISGAIIAAVLARLPTGVAIRPAE